LKLIVPVSWKKKGDIMKITRCLSFTFSVVMLISFSFGVVEAMKYELPAVSPGDFVSVIDNRYLPLLPGTTLVYQPVGEDNVLNTVQVTSAVKVILGVTCTVVHDWETEDGKLTEDTYDWYAQDKYGNVWYFGEDTKAYLPDGSVSTEGSWEAGVDGATAGIVMLADPKPGLSYRQEYYEGVAEDMGKVLRLNVGVSIARGHFAGCLKTKEWTPLGPGVIEHKYYAPRIGLVLIEELKEKTVRVELVDVY
jgi:hypothetical protein